MAMARAREHRFVARARAGDFRDLVCAGSHDARIGLLQTLFQRANLQGQFVIFEPELSYASELQSEADHPGYRRCNRQERYPYRLKVSHQPEP